MIVYVRKTGKLEEDSHAPMGSFGQISFDRLCELFERWGEVVPNEKITHLEIDGVLIKYRVERKTPLSF